MSARPGIGRPGIVTSFQVLPSSVVTLIRPLFVPAQMTPRFTVESASDWIAPPITAPGAPRSAARRSEEHTSELQSHSDLVCRLLLEKKNDQPAGRSRDGTAHAIPRFVLD